MFVAGNLVWQLCVAERVFFCMNCYRFCVGGVFFDHYGEIIEGRLIDNKPFADGEVFADQYMVVEKDIYYGYALTAHKSQGSTYDSVYVDEHDFKKISNKWNYKFRAVEQRFKERNQLKYVSYTRAATKLRVVV